VSTKKTLTYEPAPAVPETLEERYRTMLRVLSGELTVSAAARHLGLSRPRFLSLMHRGMAAMIEAIAPQPAGRPARSKRELELEAERARLAGENARLQRRVEMIDNILTVTSQIARDRIQPRARRTKTAATKDKANDDEDEGHERLRGARQMRTLGLTAQLSAALVGLSAPTMRRWSLRARSGALLRRRRGPRGSPTLCTAAAHAVESLVRRLGGQVGAESLRRTVYGVSRRQAAAIKRTTVTAMERERVACAVRIAVTAPGVMRGFDAMHVPTRTEAYPVLFAGDASVPYRTSALVVERYNACAVARALARDFERHGAPLVLRFDRASAHDAPEVRAVLRDFGVLPLHGPPRYPRYYGQLERQNREHRAWLDAHGPCDELELDAACQTMIAALNDAWRRPTLGWRTAREVWQARPCFDQDRESLHADVDDYLRRLRERPRDDTIQEDLMERLAVELALAKRGYLKREIGGWC
jgi:hypothetical protein